MSARVRVATDHEGGLVAIKTARTLEERQALRYESDLLRRCCHPGVVALVGPADLDGPLGDDELAVRYAGDPIDRWRGDLRQTAGLVAAIAATLGDLHDMGAVHGRLDGSHVLVGADGRPRLCGFAPPGDRTATDDVLDLGLLATELAERMVPVEQRWPLWRRGDVADRRAFHDVLRRATDDSLERRLSARALAAALLAAVPGAELPTGPDLAPLGDDATEPLRHPPDHDDLTAPDLRPGHDDPTSPVGRPDARLGGAGIPGASPPDAWPLPGDEDGPAIAVDPSRPAAPEARAGGRSPDLPVTDHSGRASSAVPGAWQPAARSFPVTGERVALPRDHQGPPTSRTRHGGAYASGGATASGDRPGVPADAPSRLVRPGDRRAVAGAAATGADHAAGDGEAWRSRPADRPGSAHRRPADDNGDRVRRVDPLFGDQSSTDLDEVFADRPWPATRPEGGRGDPTSRRPSPSRRRRPRRRRPTRSVPAAPVVAGLVAVVVGAVLFATGRAAPPGDPASSPPAADCAPPPSTASVVAHVDGDGCREEVLIADGVVQVNGQRWAVGSADDSVAVADWDCDGRATPAVYQSATGAVFVFPGWADATGPLEVEAADTVPGGAGIAVGDDADDPCPALAVEMPDGERRPVEVTG